MAGLPTSSTMPVIAPTDMAALTGAQSGASTASQPASNFSKTLDGIKDKTLSISSQGDDGDADAADTDTTVSTHGTTSDASVTAAIQALTGSSQKDQNDPLDALRAVATPIVPQQAPNISPATPAPHALTMQSTVGTPAFSQELGQQVAWLGGQDIKEARIRLHPEDLGELNVKVSVKQDHVDVSFIAQHPQAVHAVQQTLSQLDSMLAHHGLSLGQAQVGQGSSGNGSAQAGGSNAASQGEGGLVEGVGELVSVVAPVVKAVGLVDMFA